MGCCEGEGDWGCLVEVREEGGVGVALAEGGAEACGERCQQESVNIIEVYEQR